MCAYAAISTSPVLGSIGGVSAVPCAYNVMPATLGSARRSEQVAHRSTPTGQP